MNDDDDNFKFNNESGALFQLNNLIVKQNVKESSRHRMMSEDFNDKSNFTSMSQNVFTKLNHISPFNPESADNSNKHTRHRHHAKQSSVIDKDTKSMSFTESHIQNQSAIADQMKSVQQLNLTELISNSI